MLLKLGSLASCLLVFGVVAACGTDDAEIAPPASPPLIGDPNPSGKPAGQGCGGSGDCKSGVCAAATCQTSSHDDGVKNMTETDVDCGGAGAPGCANGKACAADADCADAKCVGYKCGGAGTDPGTGPQTQQPPPPPAPRFDDKTKNGTETDVDCGGPAAGPRCAAGQACKASTDCTSGGCTFEGKCASRPTCTALEGGFTCGPNDSTTTKQNDCCESAKVGAYEVDKYLVTAGRMRTFIAQLDGKVRDWAAKLPADKWNQAYTAQLPNGVDGDDGQSANVQLGPYYDKRSCETGYHTGHTYWTPEAYGDKKDFSQKVLDTKALNCVPWPLLAALCVYDGGHLAKMAELRAAYTNAGTTTYPWGARGTYATEGSSDYAIQEYGYDSGGGAPANGDGYFDVAAYIAPPGRRPNGYNKTGHADLVGNLLEWVGDADRQFLWKGSFERHGYEADKIEAPIDNDPYLETNPKNGQPFSWSEVAKMDGMTNGYYAVGGRCAY